ncbi:MAG: orotate phosphoribosyltransferase [Actinomycetota bacterium]|nr:orotate phosphoribosyltransferase [Actinomycetota bacterium]
MSGIGPNPKRLERFFQDSGRAGLIDHLKSHALRTDGTFTLRSGLITSWYLDARKTTLDGPGALLVARAVLAVLDGRARGVGGMTMGADPMAVATAVLGTLEGRELAAFSVRKEEKAHGSGGRLVGPLRPGDAVAVLEDTATTGGALLEAIDVVEEAGLQPLQAVALLDRSGGVVASRLRGRGIPYAALLAPADLGVAE